MTPSGRPFEGRLEDLLGRDPVECDLDSIRAELAGKRVLITGGAGSIGREIARQVARLDPRRLVIFDRAETAVYLAQRSFERSFPRAPIECVVGDVQDPVRVEWAMRTFSPHIVFHAAAFKHVPVMEAHPAEAFKNNVLGTRNVAEAAARHAAERFVLVSTDKAVNPVSVMGATKRLAELVVGEIPGKTRFVSVRFGNVLGSDGSVVTIFLDQIAEGGPVTVTHPDAARYFMTIEEAVRLVLQAGSMGSGGEVFRLDMGEPVRILDLARKLIERSVCRPGKEIAIVYTGLRPGEKLTEEICAADEEWDETSYDKVLRLKNKSAVSAVLQKVREVESVLSLYPEESDSRVRQALSDLIPAVGNRREAAPSSRRSLRAV